MGKKNAPFPLPRREWKTGQPCRSLSYLTVIVPATKENLYFGEVSVPTVAVIGYVPGAEADVAVVVIDGAPDTELAAVSVPRKPLNV